MKRVVCLLLLFCLTAPAAWGEVPEPVERARRSVVQLYGMGTDSETGLRSRWSGTGFAVGIAGENSDIFLTNWHVATGSGKYADDQVELWLLKEDAQFGPDYRPLEGSGVKCRVLITTDGYPDVAVVQAMEPVTGYPALPLMPTSRAAEGAKVYALGFSGLESVSRSGPEDVSLTAGTIRDHLVMKNAGDSQAVIHSAPIRHGFSGGPLVNEHGTAAAQNTYGFEADVSTELFCALYLEYGMELLDRLNIPYTLADEPGTGLLRRPDIGIALAAVLSIAAALTLLARLVKTVRQTLAEPGQKRAARREEPPHEN